MISGELRPVFGLQLNFAILTTAATANGVVEADEVKRFKSNDMHQASASTLPDLSVPARRVCVYAFIASV